MTRPVAQVSDSQARAELSRYCQLAWELGLMPGVDGNLSLRTGGGQMLITPSGRAKGDLAPRDMLLVDAGGQVTQGQGRASTEKAMHLAAYEVREDAGAVIHAHPPHACALAGAGVELMAGAMPEVLVHLGNPALVPYQTPASAELARAVAKHLARADALLLQNHGTLVVAENLETALKRSEMLEAACRVQLLAQGAGGLKELPPAEQQRLLAMGGRSPSQPTEFLPLAQRLELTRLPVTDGYAVEKRGGDERGQVHLIVDDRPLRRVCVLDLKPGAGYRGGHVHRQKTEGFYVSAGRGLLELVCIRTGERLELELETGHRIFIPPQVAHRISAIEPLTFVELVDMPYDPDDDLPFEF